MLLHYIINSTKFNRCEFMNFILSSRVTLISLDMYLTHIRISPTFILQVQLLDLLGSWYYRRRTNLTILVWHSSELY